MEENNDDDKITKEVRKINISICKSKTIIGINCNTLKIHITKSRESLKHIHMSCDENNNKLKYKSFVVVVDVFYYSNSYFLINISILKKSKSMHQCKIRIF